MSNIANDSGSENPAQGNAAFFHQSVIPPIPNPDVGVVTSTFGTGAHAITPIGLPSKAKKDWNALVNQDVLITSENGQQFIPLAELERLGEERGISHYETEVPFADANFAVAIVKVIGEDGTTCQGAADAGQHNIASKAYAVYPVAMAESRARGRALRTWMRIKYTCREELASLKGVDIETKPDDPIDKAKKACILEMCKRKGYEISDILALKADGPQTLDELTDGEGKALVKALNEGKIEKLLKKSKGK